MSRLKKSYVKSNERMVVCRTIVRSICSTCDYIVSLRAPAEVARDLLALSEPHMHARGPSPLFILFQPSFGLHYRKLKSRKKV